MDLQASGELYLAFKIFQDKYLRKPKETLTRAKQIHERFMKEIEFILQYYGICHHLEHAEGVRRSSDDDFQPDVLMVVDKYDDNLQVVIDYSRSGTAWLRPNRGEQPSPELDKVLNYWTLFGHIFGGDKYLDPNKAAEIFYFELKKLINCSDQMKWKVVLSSERGVSIRMDVYPDRGVLFWGERLYSANLVPAYKVGGALYVSTPYNGRVAYTLTWKRSFSVHEEKNLSEGAKCVLHAITVIRNREPDLAPLTSYQLKTVLFYEMDDEDDWSDHSLLVRFLCVLRRLEISLSFGNLPHFFYRETNLLSAVSLSCLKSMRDRIKRIRLNENELMEILKP